jgi:hypothetical protein
LGVVIERLLTLRDVFLCVQQLLAKIAHRRSSRYDFGMLLWTTWEIEFADRSKSRTRLSSSVRWGSPGGKASIFAYSCLARSTSVAASLESAAKPRGTDAKCHYLRAASHQSIGAFDANVKRLA